MLRIFFLLALYILITLPMHAQWVVLKALTCPDGSIYSMEQERMEALRTYQPSIPLQVVETALAGSVEMAYWTKEDSVVVQKGIGTATDTFLISGVKRMGRNLAAKQPETCSPLLFQFHIDVMDAPVGKVLNLPLKLVETGAFRFTELQKLLKLEASGPFPYITRPTHYRLKDVSFSVGPDALHCNGQPIALGGTNNTVLLQGDTAAIVVSRNATSTACGIEDWHFYRIGNNQAVLWKRVLFAHPPEGLIELMDLGRHTSASVEVFSIYASSTIRWAIQHSTHLCPGLYKAFFGVEPFQGMHIWQLERGNTYGELKMENKTYGVLNVAQTGDADTYVGAWVNK